MNYSLIWLVLYAIFQLGCGAIIDETPYPDDPPPITERSSVIDALLDRWSKSTFAASPEIPGLREQSAHAGSGSEVEAIRSDLVMRLHLRLIWGYAMAVGATDSLTNFPPTGDLTIYIADEQMLDLAAVIAGDIRSLRSKMQVPPFAEEWDASTAEIIKTSESVNTPDRWKPIWSHTVRAQFDAAFLVAIRQGAPDMRTAVDASREITDEGDGGHVTTVRTMIMASCL